jgi:DNA-binding transcriptional ArsR family regulator
MPGEKANLILHPVRLRILTAISTYRMTAGEISNAMPDIPLTTLYRHINALLEGGLLTIVEERPVRGTVERLYALTAPPSLTADDLEGMSREECEQAFTIYLSTLMSDAQHYLDTRSGSRKINPLVDGVHISKVQLFLTDNEFNQLNSKMMECMLEAAKNQPEAGRHRRMFSYMFIPMEND